MANVERNEKQGSGASNCEAARGARETATEGPHQFLPKGGEPRLPIRAVCSCPRSAARQPYSADPRLKELIDSPQAPLRRKGHGQATLHTPGCCFPFPISVSVSAFFPRLECGTRPQRDEPRRVFAPGRLARPRAAPALHDVELQFLRGGDELLDPPGRRSLAPEARDLGRGAWGGCSVGAAWVQHGCCQDTSGD